jgi:hypothetical protein
LIEDIERQQNATEETGKEHDGKRPRPKAKMKYNDLLSIQSY